MDAGEEKVRTGKSQGVRSARAGMQRSKRHPILRIANKLDLYAPPLPATLRSNSLRSPPHLQSPSPVSRFKASPVLHSVAAYRRTGRICLESLGSSRSSSEGIRGKAGKFDGGISQNARNRDRLIVRAKTVTMQYEDVRKDPFYVFRPTAPSPPASTRLKKLAGRRPILLPVKFNYHRQYNGVSSFQYPTTEEEATVLHPHTPAPPLPLQPLRPSLSPLHVLTRLPIALPLSDL